MSKLLKLFNTFFHLFINQEINEHFNNFFGDERDRPRKYIHEVGENVWMSSVIELLYVECVVLKLYYCSFVVVHVAVVRRWKYCYHHWKLWSSVPLMHLISFELCFMGSQYRQQLILMKELVSSLLTKEVWTPSHIVRNVFIWARAFIIFHWVWP